MDAVIYHLAIAADWERALEVGEYRTSTLGRTLEQEGFVHCSFRRQVQRIADLVYRGRDDVLLLVVDCHALHAEVREEASGGTEEFPHVYGPLPVECVRSARPVPLDGNGRLMVEAAVDWEP